MSVASAEVFPRPRRRCVHFIRPVLHFIISFSSGLFRFILEQFLEQALSVPLLLLNQLRKLRRLQHYSCQYIIFVYPAGLGSPQWPGNGACPCSIRSTYVILSAQNPVLRASISREERGLCRGRVYSVDVDTRVSHHAAVFVCRADVLGTTATEHGIQ